MKREGSVAWTFPTGLVMLAFALVAWLLFALLSRAHPPSCELQARIAWAFAATGATAAACLPLTLFENRWAAIVVSLVAGGVVFALAWWATAALFPVFC
jgi:hypothetical protein